ncbi:MAG: PstS family phosphate ABC transporter substrate-binding protein [Armatimonadota bacterium]
MKYTVLPAMLVALATASSYVAQPLHAEELSGTISISGAWAIYPLAVKWGEEFQKNHPKVKLDISAGGAGKGMTDALSGAIDIGMVSREVDKAEKAKGAYAIFIARDGVFPVISSKNAGAKQILNHGISIKSFLEIYVNNRPLNWHQIAGAPALPVHAYTRSDSCGAASAWAATLGKYKQDDLKGIGVYGDPGLLEAVRRDPLGLGYNNLSYVFKGDTVAPGVEVVPIDANRNGKVDDNERIDTRDKAYKEISAGRYPGARREFLVTKGKPNGLTRAFIEFALSEAGTRVLIDVGGYVPLSKAERAAEIGR